MQPTARSRRAAFFERRETWRAPAFVINTFRLFWKHWYNFIIKAITSAKLK